MSCEDDTKSLKKWGNSYHLFKIKCQHFFYDLYLYICVCIDTFFHVFLRPKLLKPTKITS